MLVRKASRVKAPAKRSQHFSTTHLNVVGQAFASSGQTIATFEYNVLRDCFARLAMLLQRAATYWVLKIEEMRMPGRNFVARTWPKNYNDMQHA